MVRFLKAFRNYTKGDVAGFSKQHEAWLVSKNIAEKHYVRKQEQGPTDSTQVKTDNGGTPAA